MKTQHVPSTLWRRTLDDLSRAYDGAIVSLEVLGDTTGAQVEVILRFRSPARPEIFDPAVE